LKEGTRPQIKKLQGTSKSHATILSQQRQALAQRVSCPTLSIVKLGTIASEIPMLFAVNKCCGKKSSTVSV